MKKALLSILLTLGLSTSLQAESIKQTIPTKAVGDIELTCQNPGSWNFATNLIEKEGKEYLKIHLSNTSKQEAPVFKISMEMPQKDMYHWWSSRNSSRYRFYPNWSGSSWQSSKLASSLPLHQFYNQNNQNKFTIACSEVFRDINTQMAIKEEGCVMLTTMEFFTQPEAPMQDYETTIMLDTRNVFWADAIREAAEWMSKEANITPCKVPESAYEPLYSTWYQFHQSVFDKDIEAECAIASKLGMKTIIVDDGWQTDDTNRGYAYCGDWEVSKNRFPNMREHVKKVQQMGMKYMMWYSVPYVGYKSKNYARFKDKFLEIHHSQIGILDPRFPEVRAFLVETYEKAMKEWGIDGFKLDFIDTFRMPEKDPALANNYAGRDIKSLSEAINVLMKEIIQHLQRINPDVLIEFRQSYVGPAIRQYGNMIRVGDCPGDMQANRIGIANLRLTSGNTAVHADMLEWNKEESAVNASRTIISCIFGVIQYSLMLRDIPAEHQKVIKHWLQFSQQHKDALLHGEFKPYSPEASFPLIEAQNAKERIWGVYLNNTAVKIGKVDKDNYILNGTQQNDIIIDINNNSKANIFNMYGEKIAEKSLKAGIQRINVPAGGYALIR